MTKLTTRLRHLIEQEQQSTGRRSLRVEAVKKIEDLLEAHEAEIREKAQSAPQFTDQFGIGYKYDDTIHACPSEASARRSADAVETITLHKRRVGPWEQVE